MGKRTRAKTTTRKKGFIPPALARRRARARVSSAKKGWATRRANAAKRSRAAKKGWATRRANAAKRSRAAKKGWATGKKTLKLKRQRDKRGKGKKPLPEKLLPIKFAEFAVSADYTSKKSSSSVTIQLSIEAPEDSDKEDIEQHIQDWLKDRPSPNVKIKIMDWRGRAQGQPINQGESKRALAKPLEAADIEINFPVRSHRKN